MIVGWMRDGRRPHTGYRERSVRDPTLIDTDRLTEWLAQRLDCEGLRSSRAGYRLQLPLKDEVKLRITIVFK
jgi:hypothetical protein